MKNRLNLLVLAAEIAVIALLHTAKLTGHSKPTELVHTHQAPIAPIAESAQAAFVIFHLSQDF